MSFSAIIRSELILNGPKKGMQGLRAQWVATFPQNEIGILVGPGRVPEGVRLVDVFFLDMVASIANQQTSLPSESSGFKP